MLPNKIISHRDYDIAALWPSKIKKRKSNWHQINKKQILNLWRFWRISFLDQLPWHYIMPTLMGFSLSKNWLLLLNCSLSRKIFLKKIKNLYFLASTYDKIITCESVTLSRRRDILFIFAGCAKQEMPLNKINIPPFLIDINIHQMPI